MKQVLLLIILIIEFAASCEYIEETKCFSCQNLLEVSVEGTEDWTNLIVHNPNETFTLKKDTFTKTPNLTLILLGSLTKIEPGAFNGLNKLDTLSIFDSNLEEIPTGVLDNLPIRTMQIINKINKLSPGFFDRLPNIRVVDIRNNSLGEIKAGIFNNTPIYKLYLDHNKINVIDNEAFVDMDSMIFLSLTGNNLNTFNAELLLGSNSLQQLWLSRNILTKITKSMFSKLSDLKKLYLEINQIESIEDGTFYNLSELVLLDISNNKLQEIQPKVFPKEGLKDLYDFFIHNNRLTFINNELFVKTPNLKHISYGGNPFQCPCLDETKDWMDTHNITILCDDVYSSGDRPLCVFADSSKKCIYNVELTKNLFELYEEALKDYPKLDLICDPTNKINNTILNGGEFVSF